MSEGKNSYNPNKVGTLDIKLMAKEFLPALESAHSSAIEGLRKNLEINFSEDDENRFIDLLEMDEWEVKDLLELSSTLFAIAVMQSYEEKNG